jgi:2-C-methyl-D-erythritol 4-phosphate cytidylyltransferase
MNIGLIITAGGSGSRFGVEGGKQLAQINGKPMVVATCEKFIGVKEISEVIITIDAAAKDKLEVALLAVKLDFPLKIVLGGETRTESVYNALKQLSGGYDKVMIHDGARPNLSEELIQRLVAKAKTETAVIPVIPVVDTIKWVENDVVKETLPREKLFAVQTPQIFSYEIIMAAYNKFSGAVVTDDASLVEKMGVEVAVVDGERANIKVTYFNDLEAVS